MSDTTLTYGTTTVVLPVDLYWPDETEWHPLVQSAERTITGALIVQSAARVGGRPITLVPPDESASWMPRETLDVLMGWAAIPDCEMLLSYRGMLHNVVWRHYEGSVLPSKPIIHYRDVVPGDWYSTTLKLMEI